MNWIIKIYDNKITKFIILVLIVLNLLFLVHYVSIFTKRFLDDKETFYWLFSSSAQTIAAFVAFLVTGYSLVNSIMDNLQQKDESLEEIHLDLKNQYYFRIKTLSTITGLAIIFSLAMVLLSGINFNLKHDLIVITSLLNLIAIVTGIWFVISIIDPNKYSKTAKKLIEEKGFETTGEVVAPEIFFTKFVDLENSIRSLLESRKILVKSKVRFPGYRDMINELLYNQVITADLHNMLLKIGQMRNLVFHGHLKSVDKGTLRQLEIVLGKINQLLDKIVLTSDNF
ncbi:hypothetical protein [Desulforamulus aeronauticus]|uniref:Uncharacterized protein n=1 Tax=Desulforamulus aeronauticus DSM 10349 TaxID=1121421 RepID=A0A1M6QG49_9FIRM|nr:hypothetical protein [Desulforamulus aeronauticus]SHK19148.1 hypothetical protein SAMN02745123_01026 [Desulforamulus aeronauticus DSM 10349]